MPPRSGGWLCLVESGRDGGRRRRPFASVPHRTSVGLADPLLAPPCDNRWVSDIGVRPASLGDAPAIAALTTQLGYPSAGEKIAERLAALIEDDRHAVFVAEHGGALVGWAHVADAPLLQDEPGAELEGIVVAEDARGSGVGRGLVGVAEVWARRRGLGVLRVRSRSTREDAHAFYRRLGFEDVKTSLVFAHRLDG